MSWIEALVLGGLQGLTEFLPVSSSGHLVVAQQVFAALRGVTPSASDNLFFNVMVHVGTVVAILVHYQAVGRTAARGLAGSTQVPPPYRRGALIRVGLLAAVATLPAMVVGLFFKELVEQATVNPVVAGVGFLITATVLIVTIRLPEGHKSPSQTTWRDALVIGLAQAFAILPGVSRSGMTIASALGLGLSRSWAVGFSLLMAVPAILGAAVLELKSASTATMPPEWVAQTLVAATLAGVVGYGAILWLVRVVRGGQLWYFSVYLVILAAVVLVSAMRDQTDAGRSRTMALDGPVRVGASGPGAG